MFSAIWDTIKLTLTLYLAFFTVFGALSAFGCLIGVWFGVKQIRLGAWVNAQEIVTNPEFTDTRTRIQDHFENLEYVPTKNDIEDAKLVCRRWDQLCWLVFEGFISKEKVLQYWRFPMGKCFIIVEERWNIIKKERGIARGHLDKWDAFFKLGNEAARIIENEIRQRKE